MTFDWKQFTPLCNISLRICKSFIGEWFLFPFFSFQVFEVLYIHKKQLHTESPNTGMRRDHDLWVTSSTPGMLASHYMWHVCIFAAELTKLWPCRSLCWILLQVECRNYIRTLHRVNNTAMYVCGTNAFSPTCDYVVSLEHVLGLEDLTNWTSVH